MNINKRLSYLIDNQTRWVIKPKNTIVINGFWRSGTTWILQIFSEIFNGKSIFEPLHWKVKEYKYILDNIGTLPSNEIGYYKMYYPSYDNIENYPILKRYLKKIIYSNIKENWIRRGRNKDFKLSQTPIIKFVRGHLILSYFYNNYNATLFHVIRDPRAIYASLKRNNWGQFLSEISLASLLLEPIDERRIFYNRYNELIRKFDKEEDVTTKIIAYWALTELYIEEIKNLYNIYIINYENLVNNGYKHLTEILPNNLYININTTNNILEKNSATTQSNRLITSPFSRINSWKYELTKSEIKDINRIVDLFGLQNRLYN